MLLGDLRQSDQRTQSFHFPIVIHQSLDPAARSSAQAPSSFTCLYMHFEVRALDRLRVRTRRRVCIGSARRRGNHMHDHSRFQRDINDVTGVSLSLSLLLTKVTHAQYRKRFRASYNKRMPFRGMNVCLSVQQTDLDTRMHSVIAAFNRRFVFLRSSLDHVREILTFVRVVVCLTKADIMPPLQIQELRKPVARRLPIMYAKSRSNDRLTRDPQPPPTKQTLSLSGVSSSS